MFINNFIHQRAFAGTRHAGHTGEHTQWDIHIDVLQIVLPGTFYFDKSCRFSSGGGNRNLFGSAQILSCNGRGILHDLLCGAHCHHLASMGAGSRSYIHNIVRFQHGVLIMLYHKQRVAHIPEIFQGSKKLVIIPLMKSDTGFVQNIAHAYQPGTNLGSQTNSLGFTAG